MNFNKYKNIEITKKIDDANCITHSGKFHVDDVISTIFLGKLKKDVILIRVPTIKNINIENKIVYDIGLGEFDHHQKNRNGQRKNGIYYSSIGLLWRKFGRKYLEELEVKNVDKTFQYMDDELIQYIDATDNMQTENNRTKNYVYTYLQIYIYMIKYLYYRLPATINRYYQIMVERKEPYERKSTELLKRRRKLRKGKSKQETSFQQKLQWYANF